MPATTIPLGTEKAGLDSWRVQHSTNKAPGPPLVYSTGVFLGALVDMKPVSTAVIIP